MVRIVKNRKGKIGYGLTFKKGKTFYRVISYYGTTPIILEELVDGRIGTKIEVDEDVIYDLYIRVDFTSKPRKKTIINDQRFKVNR